MTYSDEQRAIFPGELQRVQQGLYELGFKTFAESQKDLGVDAVEYLTHGVARRLSVIRRSIENIFQIFPPQTEKPLTRDELSDVQINLHAYVINISGIFDNWAWAFVHRHQLIERVGGKHKVGLFRDETRALLPTEILDYLRKPEIESWQSRYVKDYRDALAHRIPLYVPPSAVTQEEADRYNELEQQKFALIQQMDWETLGQVYDEQAQIGRAAMVFTHSLSSEHLAPVLFHPQLLSDGLAIIEFGHIFTDHWGNVAGTD